MCTACLDLHKTHRGDTGLNYIRWTAACEREVVLGKEACIIRMYTYEYTHRAYGVDTGSTDTVYCSGTGEAVLDPR
jgi:hypothetical protein